jgi:iron-sulfur cluster assembly accessory protein
MRIIVQRAVANASLLSRVATSSKALPILPSSSTPQSYFSTAVAVSDDVPRKTPKNRRRLIETKDPIIVTPRAEERIRELLDGQNDTLGIRLGVRRRGCNGLSYTLNYAKPDQDHTKDIQMKTISGIQVFIEPMALFNIVGTTMDWEETELSSEFTFNNPNSKGECGCGESFNV